MRTSTQRFDLELLEKELYTINLVEKEIIEVILYSVDVIPRKTYITELSDVNITTPQEDDILQYDSDSEQWKNQPIIDIIDANNIYNEVPTKLTAKRFQTDNNFVTGSLRVYLNGIKLLSSDITIINNNKFEISIDTKSDDSVEVNYIKD